MRATILDLRYRTKDILKALRNREKVTILYHGVETGVIHPAVAEGRAPKVTDSQFFGMCAGAQESVPETMKRLRRNRNAI